MKYYVIIGSTGEYSDRSEWSVCLVKSEEEAKQYVTFAEKCAKEIEVLTKRKWDELKKYQNPYDANMQIDYTGTYYFYQAVEVIEEVREMDIIKVTQTD